MNQSAFDRAVFVNCPFDDEYSSLLEAMVFCIVYFGLAPRLANERIETGENRLDKISEMIRSSKYSIHDLSRCKSRDVGEYYRMNMPFELGMDVGFRRSGIENLREKKFLIFEENQYDLKKAISDIAGQDVQYHNNDFETVIEKVRNFFRVEAELAAPGPSRLISEYATFQGWMMEKKLYEGHSENEVLRLPTRERLDEMKCWMELGRPSMFSTSHV